MAQPPSLSSNNPFRRKPPIPSEASAPPPPFPETEASTLAPEDAPALPSGDRFRNHLQALSHPSQPPPATSFQKPKVVKKVRVQSPPPSSPESAGVPDRFPLDDDDDESSSSVDTDDQIEPFGYASSTGSARWSDKGVAPQSTLSHQPPPNPFQKTLRDLEVGLTGPSQDSSTAPGARNTLDVDAFKRLLLTGQAGGSGAPQAAAPQTAQQTAQPLLPSGDAASTADTSSTSRQSIFDAIQAVQETPRTSHEVSEHEAEDDRRGLISSSQSSLQPAPTILRKKPPPPSSRHGKLIKVGAGSEAKGTPGVAQPASPSSGLTYSASIPLSSPPRQISSPPSDFNKPLPPAPKKSPAEEDTDSVFDREAAGKVPELEIQPGLNIIMPPRPPTPPNVPHTTPNPPVATSQPTRKPAPPPRRQPHGRSESRTVPSVTGSLRQDDTDPPIRRSSIDSTRSRSSSLRVSVHAPAPPPPPRRPSHATRVPTSLTSPGVASPGSEKTLSAVEQSPLVAPIVASPPPLDDTPTSASASSSTVDNPAISPRIISSPPPLALNHYSHPQSQSQPQPPLSQQPHVHPKLFPPPPPPARNPSVRAKKRPVSLVPRRESGNSVAPPQPPPPPRRRGSSRASLDGPGSGLGSTRLDVVVDGHGPTDIGGLVEEPVQEPETASAAVDILADLGALQREIDALRGKYETGGGKE